MSVKRLAFWEHVMADIKEDEHQLQTSMDEHQGGPKIGTTDANRSVTTNGSPSASLSQCGTSSGPEKSMWDTKQTRRGRVSHWSGPGGAEADIKYATKGDDEHQVNPQRR